MRRRGKGTRTARRFRTLRTGRGQSALLRLEMEGRLRALAVQLRRQAAAA
jgi:hypothetical protein